MNARFTIAFLALLAVGRGAALASSFDLAGAIASAPEGAVLQVPAGTYAGPLTIDRSVSLIAEGEVVLDGGGEGDVITIKAPDVTIRGFTIRNTGISLDRENAGISVLAPRVTLEHNVLEDVLFGMYLKEAGDSVIRHNVIGGKDLGVARRGDGIRLWYSPRTIVEDNVVHNSRDVVMWFSNAVQLRRNEVRDGRYGLHFMYSDDNILEDNRLEGNSVGAFLMYSDNLTLRRNIFARNRGPSGYGVGLKDMDGVTAHDNVFLGNRIGVYLDNSPSSVDVTHEFRGNVFGFNDIGVAFQPSVQRNRFVDNAFLENIEQVAVFGGGNFRGNDFTIDDRGNFWSDYRGYDLDEDGIGDLAYVSQSLFENLMDREPKLRLFMFSPAQQAIDMAARAFPVVMPHPKFSDTAPLMTPHVSEAPVTARTSPAGLLWVAGCLVGAGGLVLGWGARGARGAAAPSDAAFAPYTEGRKAPA